MCFMFTDELQTDLQRTLVENSENYTLHATAEFVLNSLHRQQFIKYIILILKQVFTKGQIVNKAHSQLRRDF